jgi:hypothetical protein
VLGQGVGDDVGAVTAGELDEHDESAGELDEHDESAVALDERGDGGHALAVEQVAFRKGVGSPGGVGCG